MSDLPHALANEKILFDKVNGKTLAVFLDYDGTLTPIVDRPELAILPKATQKTLSDLSKEITVAIISGRARENVESLVNIPNLIYAGAHGFDIKGPSISMIPAEVEPLIPVVQKAYQRLKDETSDIEGCLIEDKKFALAAHYRLVDPSEVPRLESMVDSIATEEAGLRKTTGKMVFELRAKIPWDKGKALLYLLKALHQDGSNVIPFYFGDDDTDEDAFRVLAGKGIGILVSETNRHTQAEYFLKNPIEVNIFLEKLLSWIK